MKQCKFTVLCHTRLRYNICSEFNQKLVALIWIWSHDSIDSNTTAPQQVSLHSTFHTQRYTQRTCDLSNSFSTSTSETCASIMRCLIDEISSLFLGKPFPTTLSIFIGSTIFETFDFAFRCPTGIRAADATNYKYLCQNPKNSWHYYQRIINI